MPALPVRDWPGEGAPPFPPFPARNRRNKGEQGNMVNVLAPSMEVASSLLIKGASPFTRVRNSSGLYDDCYESHATFSASLFGPCSFTLRVLAEFIAVRSTHLENDVFLVLAYIFEAELRVKFANTDICDLTCWERYSDSSRQQ